jgi:hypothetical protein
MALVALAVEHYFHDRHRTRYVLLLSPTPRIERREKYTGEYHFHDSRRFLFAVFELSYYISYRLTHAALLFYMHHNFTHAGFSWAMFWVETSQVT